MEERLFITDIEFIVVLIGLCVLYCLALEVKCLHGKLCVLRPCRAWLCLNKQNSVLIKGIACVFILLSHYSARTLGGGLPTSVSYYVTDYAANIALILFMFLSGYGLSLKEHESGHLLSEWLKRISKVYLPLVFACTISTLLAVLFGTPYGGGKFLLSVFGFTDEWYVICIIYFYTIFYLAVFLSIRLNINESIVLSIFMLIYYVVAYWLYGFEEGHFFRFPCAFMLGHVVAKGEKNSQFLGWGLAIIFILTIVPHGLHFFKCYLLAFLLLISIGMLQSFVQIRTSSILYKLGILSFFFYLVHERLGFRLMTGLGMQSCILWIVITIIIAYLLQQIYNRFSFRK